MNIGGKCYVMSSIHAVDFNLLFYMVVCSSVYLENSSRAGHKLSFAVDNSSVNHMNNAMYRTEITTQHQLSV